MYDMDVPNTNKQKYLSSDTNYIKNTNKKYIII